MYGVANRYRLLFSWALLLSSLILYYFVFHTTLEDRSSSCIFVSILRYVMLIFISFKHTLSFMIVIISYLIPPLEIDHCLLVVSYRFIGMLLLFVAVIYDELLFLFVQSYVVVHDCYYFIPPLEIVRWYWFFLCFH